MSQPLYTHVWNQALFYEGPAVAFVGFISWVLLSFFCCYCHDSLLWYSCTSVQAPYGKIFLEKMSVQLICPQFWRREIFLSHPTSFC